MEQYFDSPWSKPSAGNAEKHIFLFSPLVLVIAMLGPTRDIVMPNLEALSYWLEWKEILRRPNQTLGKAIPRRQGDKFLP